MQEKLDAWDPSKADDVQYLMSMAKKYVVLDTLVANGGKCTYEVLFARSEELHCDVLAAALKSLKKSKAVSYEGRAQSPRTTPFCATLAASAASAGALPSRRDAADADGQGRGDRAGRQRL